jgi:hypothetical protein
MTAFSANLLNSFILIIFGMWGFLDAYNADGTNMSKTTLIPIVFGVVFLICSPWIKKHNKSVAHVVVLMTLVLLIALIKPLMAREGTAQIRVAVEMLGCLIALIFFIKSFIDARKARQQNATGV